MDLQIIQNKIYEIRGHRVMLDFDLAVMYQVETRVLKQAVRRNIDRFPADDFMLKLSKNEANELIHIGVSQFVIPHGYNPGGADIFAFTELGVAMLSSVLRSDTAIKMNISIMRAFVSMRSLIVDYPVSEVKKLKTELHELKAHIEDAFTDYNDINEDTRTQLALISESLAELQARSMTEDKPRRPVGYVKPQ